MKSGSFYEEGSRVLTPGAFQFVLDSELKRALRSQTFLTLVLVEATREWDGMRVTADDGTVQELAQLIGREIRDTDLMAQTEKGSLSVVLLDADFDHSRRVVDRLMARIDDYAFPTPLAIAVGAACYPTHAVDAESLRREAASRPLILRRRGIPDRSPAE